MLNSFKKEILEENSSLSLAIYEYANLGNQDLFIKINNHAKNRWISLINYGMETNEFKTVNPQQVADLILYYYQGLRMWSRVIPFEKTEADFYEKTIKDTLLNKP